MAPEVVTRGKDHTNLYLSNLLEKDLTARDLMYG